MAQTLSEEKKQEWKKIILNQHRTGFSIESRCLKNNMVVNAFYCRQSKLLPIPIFERSSFIEVPLELECTTPDLNTAEIKLIYQEFQLLLEKQFKPSILKQCLVALKESIC